MKNTFAIAILVMACLAVGASAHYVPPSPAITYSPENPTLCDVVAFNITHADHFTFNLSFGDGVFKVVKGDHPDHGNTSHQYTTPGTMTAALYYGSDPICEMVGHGPGRHLECEDPIDTATITVLPCPLPPAPSIQSSGFFPYTADPAAPLQCDGAIPDRADIETHILEGQALAVEMVNCGPFGCTFVDTFRVYRLIEAGDPSCNSAGTMRQYFTICAMDSLAGIGPLSIPIGPSVERIRIVGAKEETLYPGATQLKVRIKEITTGRLVWPLTPAEEDLAKTHGDETTYDHTLGFDPDLSGCHSNGAEAAGWIFGVPSL
jgi:hypothetical protein